MAARSSRRTCRCPCRYPVTAGTPEDAFPYPWGVVQWLPGRDGDPRGGSTIRSRAARDLAAFVRALRSVDASGGPRHVRGSPVRRADEVLHNQDAQLRGEVDARRAARRVGTGARRARLRRTAGVVPRRSLVPQRVGPRRPGVQRHRLGDVRGRRPGDRHDRRVELVRRRRPRHVPRSARLRRRRVGTGQGLGVAGCRGNPVLPRHEPGARGRQGPRHRGRPIGLRAARARSAQTRARRRVATRGLRLC